MPRFTVACVSAQSRNFDGGEYVDRQKKRKFLIHNMFILFRTWARTLQTYSARITICKYIRVYLLPIYARVYKLYRIVWYVLKIEENQKIDIKISSWKISFSKHEIPSFKPNPQFSTQKSQIPSNINMSSNASIQIKTNPSNIKRPDPVVSQNEQSTNPFTYHKY